MRAFLYGVMLQWKLDIRSKTLLITCYVVPLLFFAVVSGIFVSVNPESRDTLVQAMTVMGVSMGALIGLPPKPTAAISRRYTRPTACRCPSAWLPCIYRRLSICSS